MNNERRRKYIQTLEEHIRQYLNTLEQLLGPPDPLFAFGTVMLTVSKRDVPHISLPLGGGNPHRLSIINVHISKEPWENLWLNQGVWQVAHESVHLLDPGPLGGVNILEEGLAAWFQNEPKFHDEELWPYIEKGKKVLPSSYAEARQQVLDCMPESHLCPAVKKIRSSGVRIRDIEEDMLRSHLPHASDDTIERLCAPFSGA